LALIAAKGPFVAWRRFISDSKISKALLWPDVAAGRGQIDVAMNRDHFLKMVKNSLDPTKRNGGHRAITQCLGKRDDGDETP